MKMKTFKEMITENAYSDKKILKALNKTKIDQYDWSVWERTTFQRAIFEAGLTWLGDTNEISNTNDNRDQYYFINKGKLGVSDKEYFDKQPQKELSKEEVFKILGIKL